MKLGVREGALVGGGTWRSVEEGRGMDGMIELHFHKNKTKFAREILHTFTYLTICFNNT